MPQKNTRDKFYKNLPAVPGVYLMRDGKRGVLYVGKAVNLRRRVSGYFLRPQEARLEQMLNKVKRVDFKKTTGAIEALVLEADLIKKFSPPYNIREKDDKSFLYVVILKERFPRVLLLRGKDIEEDKNLKIADKFGPFTSAQSAREALKLLRRIFPFNTHAPGEVGSFKRPCLNAEMGVCPGTCVSGISGREYSKNISQLKMFLRGKSKRLVVLLKKEMAGAAKAEEYEAAQKLRNRIFALRHIQDVALIKDEVSDLNSALQVSERKIEGYDISNIGGTSAVGSMVLFVGGRPDRKQYRRFKIKTVAGADDFGMMREVLERRLRHAEWPLPDLILIDGGVGQVGAARKALLRSSKRIPILGIVKGPERKRNDVFGDIPAWTNLPILVRVRDEAHRFAISYHKKIRSRNFLK